jgi:RNA polymerase sigma-70 factor (ECF subfamily)
MTGSAADADDVVQDAFARTLRKPPNTSRPIYPWLVSVTLNLSRDLLRRRKTRGYVGAWLPGPSVDVGDDLPDLAPSSEARYGLKESASYAFLVSLEALTPLQRAVLLLRDVLDYSVHETAECLETKDDAVKSAHLRARRAMESYDTRRSSMEELDGRTRRALERLLAALGEGPEALAHLLSDDVRAVTDGGGEFAAALLPIKTTAKVARFLAKLASHTTVTRAELVQANGLPALLVEQVHKNPRAGKRLLLRVDVDSRDRITEIHVVLATRKLVRFFE